jgi:hypothetical protein
MAKENRLYTSLFFLAYNIIKRGDIMAVIDMEFEIQKVLYNALMANSTLLALVGSRLYDEPPENLTYPYVVIGGGGSVPHLRHEYDGTNNLFLITIFTDPGRLGFYPALTIASQIKSSLHLKKLTMFNDKLVNVITKEDSVDRERDGAYRNIDLRYRVIVEKTEKEA